MKCLFLILWLSWGLAACTNFQGSRTAQENRIEYLSQQLKQSRIQVEQLKSENLILRAKRRTSSQKYSRLSLHSSHQKTLSTKKDSKKASEIKIYKKIIALYRNQKSSDLKQHVDALIGKYPTSIYGDNALYLYGKHLYRSGEYAYALEPLNRALKLFPKGNKRASILLTKSMIYKTLKLDIQARMILKEIVGTYPGSKEANQAHLELTSYQDISKGESKKL